MDPLEEFEHQRKKDAAEMRASGEFTRLSSAWFVKSCEYKYSYNFNWLGVPIIQYPQDILAMQDVIWKIKPDVVIETGVARGGSLILWSSILELIGKGSVLGIDVEIRPHNRKVIEEHPLGKRITLLEGSSIDASVFDKAKAFAEKSKKTLVCLDSNHTHSHVLRELELYSQLVTNGSYLVVFDTVVEDMPSKFFGDKPWDKGNNPKTAVWEFLKNNSRFEIDREIENRLMISVAPDGYLRCVRD